MDTRLQSYRIVQKPLWVMLAALGLAMLACGPLGQASPTATLFVPSTQEEPLPPASTPTAMPTAPVTTEPTATIDIGNANIQLTAVFQLTDVAGTAAASTGSVEQWAVAASASSQYADTDWSASRATGAPDAYPTCGDNVNAWASAGGGSENEYIQLAYATPVYATRIDIYEVYNPGSIVQVELVDEAGQTYVVYQGFPSPAPECPRLFSVGVTMAQTRVNGVIVRLNQSLVGSWDEIDAVLLVGNP